MRTAAKRKAAGLTIALPFIAMPVLAGAPAAFAQSPPPLWTGPYVGVNGGVGGGASGFSQALVNPNLPLLPLFESRSGAASGAGFFVGGQFGYLHRFDNQAVFGVETDMQWSDLRYAAHAGSALLPGGGAAVEAAQVSVDWFGSTRLRSGYAIGRLLPYATVGVAYGGLSARADGGAVNGALARASQSAASATHVGWTAGAGLEYALTRALSFKSEYLYTQFGGVGGGTTSYAVAGPAGFGAGAFSASSVGFHLVRAGLNYNFAGASAASASFETPGMSAHDWSGFYLGVNGGYGVGFIDQRDMQTVPTLGLATATHASTRAEGALAGGQAGYNYQFGNRFVLGVETDAQWSDIRWASGPLTVAPAPQGGLSWFGATRARLGFSFDRVMPYVTGGVAYGALHTSGVMSVWSPAPPGLMDYYRAEASGVRAGWTAGGGVEYALTDQLSLKTQYDYLDFGGVSGAGAGRRIEGFAGAPPVIDGPRIGALSTPAIGLHVVRAGVNWRFSPGTF